MADIFISYTDSDRHWAFWIAQELTVLGHTPRVHEWELPGGGDIMAWMEERHHAADHVLCIVSKAYLDKPYSSWERRAAQWAAATDRPGFVLPVFVEGCEARTLFAHLKRCELYGVSEEAARARLKAFLEPGGKSSERNSFPSAPEIVSGATSSQPSERFPGKNTLSNIPIRIPRHFMGRDDALASIGAALKRYEGRVAITTLYGLRGVGKTTLAATYAERHCSSYRATWWIRAQTESTMRSDLVALGVRLEWVGADDKEEPALVTVMERLRQEGEGILLIFDNAVDANALKPYLPRGGLVQVLVTSNAPAWRGVAEPVQILLWPKEIGAEYLIARTGREEERGEAEALSEALGGLPLAHEQAAAYCERLDISLADYRKRFETAPARLLDDQRHAPVEYHDGLTVAKTFALAIEQANKLHPAAEPVIVYAALLAPEPIPLFLFSEGRERFGEPLALTLADEGLDEAVAALRDFALVDRGVIEDERNSAITTDTIRLHRLVRQVAAERRVGTARENARARLMDVLAALYPQDVFDNQEAWPRTRRIDGHTFALVCGDTPLPNGTEQRTSELLTRLASYRYRALGAYAQARPLYERALTICEKALGDEHSETATMLDNLGLVLSSQGDFARARPLYERALAIREKVDPWHTLTSLSLNHLAGLLQSQGDFAGALPLYERALAINEKTSGYEHPHTAGTLSNLAYLLQNQGDFVRARPLCERALAIREKALGPEHHYTATSLNNLADLLQNQGDFVQARPLYERALAIREKAFGSEHPNTAASLSNLATLLHTQGDLPEAQRLCERALALREKALGHEHPDTAASLSNLATLVHAQGDFARARPLYERALAIAEKAFHTRHPVTQRYQSRYARLLVDTGRSAEALALAAAALAIHKTTSGPKHPWTKDSARATADALNALGRADEAMALRGQYGLGGDADHLSKEQ